MTENKNRQILKIFNKIKEHSLHEYDDINPDEYISPEQFIRLFSFKHYPFENIYLNNEKPKVIINKNGYGYISFPQPSLYDDNIEELFKLSQNIIKIEHKVKGWIIDLRSNTGGTELCFLLLIIIFIDIEYEGLLYSIIKNDNDIITDASIYNNTLFLRSKYAQQPRIYNIKDKLHRVKNKKNIKIIVDQYTGSGSEYVCLVLKSFGAKIYGEQDKTLGVLNLTSGYLIDDVISIHFPNAHVYDKNNLKNNIYIESIKNIKSQYLLP